MKKILSSLFVMSMLFLSFQDADAQVKTPAASPAAKVMQTVGLTEVSIAYSRPGVKGRTIFGDLVPYDKMWRTGANKNPIITFSDDVMVGETALKKGEYAIFTKPGKMEWEVYFYTDTNNWGTPETWDEAKVAAKVMAKPMSLNHSLESFTMSIHNISDGGASLTIAWDKTAIQVPFTVPTDATVMASIDKIMAGPSANDYYNAARYYKDSGKDMAQALTWINKSLKMGGDKFWILRHKSLIQAKLGDKKGAIATAKKSKELAAAAGNDGYVKMNTVSIAEWSKGM